MARWETGFCSFELVHWDVYKGKDRIVWREGRCFNELCAQPGRGRTRVHSHPQITKFSSWVIKKVIDTGGTLAVDKVASEWGQAQQTSFLREKGSDPHPLPSGPCLSQTIYTSKQSPRDLRLLQTAYTEGSHGGLAEEDFVSR